MTARNSGSARDGREPEQQERAPRLRDRTAKRVEQFGAWLKERGAELLDPTNEWEVVRFRAEGGTSIIYRKKDGTWTFTGLAGQAWGAFCGKAAGYHFVVREPGTNNNGGPPNEPVIQTILRRDGPNCFYCDDPFTEYLRPTKEHLVARTHGGPGHISNLFLSCAGCNRRAGHLAAPEKIKLRETIRAERAALGLQVPFELLPPMEKTR